MKLLVQRVTNANVKVDNKIVGEIGKGFLAFLGITHDDDYEKADYLIKKLCNLRVFKDENDKLNLSIKDIDGELLIVSQFTLYADCRHGNRPGFTDAASPDKAEELYEYFKNKCRQEVRNVQCGIFGADMKVSLLNDGPVTIILEK